MIKRLRSKLHGAINPFPIILHEWYPAALKALSDSGYHRFGSSWKHFPEGWLLTKPPPLRFQAPFAVITALPQTPGGSFRSLSRRLLSA